MDIATGGSGGMSYEAILVDPIFGRNLTREASTQNRGHHPVLSAKLQF